MNSNTRQTFNPRFIQSMEAKELAKRPFVIRIADDLTALFGGIPFLTLNFLVFAIWILGNLGFIPDFPIFDPYPFTFLTMSVSLEAIFLSIIVLMSQTRQGYISTLREELDMQVDLLAEREITKVLKILKTIADSRGIKVDDAEIDEMLKETDVSYIERQIQKQLEEANKNNNNIIERLKEAVKE